MMFSIVTITRNDAPGLIRTGQSLTAQSFTDYEWIVIDGASADGTAAWLATTGALWTSEPDKGIYDAMNKGIARARGTYILFLNAGDRLAAPDTLARLRDAIAALTTSAAPAPAFLYGDSWEDRPGAPPALKKARSHDRIAYGMFTHHQAMLYRRDALDEIRYNTRLRIAADYEFTARFLRRFAYQKKRILYCPFPICIFAPGGLSQRQTAQGRAEQFRVRHDLRLVPKPMNVMIYIRQTAGIFIRRIAPSLYWRIKTRAR